MTETDKQKCNRVLYLYKELLNEKLIKKSEIAKMFGVTEKSIQRDLEDIRTFIDSQNTVEGTNDSLIYDYKERGYRIESVERLRLSNAEILAVGKILLESRAFTKKEMHSLLDRLIENCIPKRNRKLVNDLISNEKFHYVEPKHRKKFIDMLLPLGEAIKDCRIVKIKYAKMKGRSTVERILQPVAILFSEYYFYLAAFIEDIDKKKFEVANDPFPTIYRIDRIKQLEVTDEHFCTPYKNKFEEGEFRKRVQFMYGGKLQKVRFKYIGESPEAVLDRLPTAKILEENEGAYTIEAEVFGKGIDMWVRSQGDKIIEYIIT